MSFLLVTTAHGFTSNCGNGKYLNLNFYRPLQRFCIRSFKKLCFCPCCQHLVAGNLNLPKIVVFALYMYQAVVALLASVYNLVVGNLNLSKIVVVALYVPGCCWLACTTWWREILITQKLSSLPYMYLVGVGQRVPLGGGKFESIKYCRL